VGSFNLEQIKYTNNEYMVNPIYMGGWGFSRYYEESDTNSIHVTALPLHLEKRRGYVDGHWPEEWRDIPVPAARQLWAKYRNRSFVAQNLANMGYFEVGLSDAITCVSTRAHENTLSDINESDGDER
jgi:hypothetical protein